MAKKTSSQLVEGGSPRHRIKAEVQGACVTLISIAFLLSLVSFKVGHPSANWLGLLGYGLGYSLRFVFGLGSYSLVIFGGWVGATLLFKNEVPSLKRKIIYFLFFLFSFCLLLDLAAEGLPILDNWFTQLSSREIDRYYLGGVPLDYLYRGASGANLRLLLSPFGTLLISLFTALTALLLLFDAPLTVLIKKIVLAFTLPFSRDKWSAFFSRFKKKRPSCPPQGRAH